MSGPRLTRRRTGQLYKSADGTHFVVRLTLPDGRRSSPIHLPDGLSEAQAQKARLELSRRAAKGELATVDASGRVDVTTIADVAKAWLELVTRDARLTPATIAGHIGQARVAVERFGNIRPSELKTPDLRAWLRDLRGSRSASRTRNIFNTFSKMLDDAIAEEWIQLPANPARHPKVRKELPAPKVRTDEDIVRLTESEASRLIQATASPVRRLRYILAFTTGMRDGELAGLTWADIETEDGLKFLRVRSSIALRGPEGHATRKGPKTTDSKRPSPIHPVALPALEEWRSSGWANYVGRPPTDGDPILPSRKGTPFRPRSAELFRADLKAAGLPTNYAGRPFVFKATRASFTTALFVHGVSTDMADALMGHSRKSVRERHYLGIDRRERARAVGLLQIEVGRPRSDTRSDTEVPESLLGSCQEVHVKQELGGVAEWSMAAVLKTASNRENAAFFADSIAPTLSTDPPKTRSFLPLVGTLSETDALLELRGLALSNRLLGEAEAALEAWLAIEETEVAR